MRRRLVAPGWSLHRFESMCQIDSPTVAPTVTTFDTRARRALRVGALNDQEKRCTSKHFGWSVLRFAIVFKQSLGGLLGVLVTLVSGHGVADYPMRYFAHEDQRYLQQHQRDGGAALVPENVAPEASVPLVVFLHGTNASGDLHRWLGGGEGDLRPLATRLMNKGKVRPFVLAGPSQTKAASLARTLWADFDLHAFVEDVARATADVVQIDRRQVVFAGHSGAGCNPTGGLATDFWTDARQAPFAIVPIDPCLDAEMGKALARRPSTVPVLVWWQSAIWSRSQDEFWSSLVADKPSERVDRMTELRAAGPNPHHSIVSPAFAQMVSELLPVEPRAAE